MLVALVESQATMDKGCILATAQLKSAGLLAAEKLKEARLEDIVACVSRAGFGNISAVYLKRIGTAITDDHGGAIPNDFVSLCSLSGMGPKASNVAMNEIFGKAEGIATDRHVHDIAHCLFGHVQPPWLKNSHVDHVEASLRTWVSVGDFTMFNRVLGGMAQLWTSMYHSVNSKEKMENARLVVRALGDHLWKPYHVELLWYAVVSIRQYYLVSKPTIIAMEKATKKVGTTLTTAKRQTATTAEKTTTTKTTTKSKTARRSARKISK